MLLEWARLNTVFKRYVLPLPVRPVTNLILLLPPLYYLHIEETSEDACYLPDGAEHRLFELSYDATAQQFRHPAYDDKAAALLSEMKKLRS